MARRDLLLPRRRSRAARVAAMAARRQHLSGDEKDHAGEGECRGVPLESITRRPPAPVSAVEGCTGRGSTSTSFAARSSLDEVGINFIGGRASPFIPSAWTGIHRPDPAHLQAKGELVALPSWANQDLVQAPAGPTSIDLLLIILERLELPHALAFAAVCTTWSSAATAAGVPRSRTPWIMSWGNHVDKRLDERRRSAVTCNLYHPDDAVDKIYSVSFPKGSFVACYGASHGWLVLANDLSNLVLHNPVTLAMIPLPPITDFACVEAVYGSEEGNLEHYLLETNSRGGDYVVMIIHNNGEWLSFVKAGQSKWQVASTLSGGDRYLDCAYHKGRFHAVTLHGMVEKWDLDGASNGPTREVFYAARPYGGLGLILTRHLVSTPWGECFDGSCTIPWIESLRMLTHPEFARDTTSLTYDLETGKFERAVPFCDVKEQIYGLFPSEF
uniref:KIB1-4 beta-propeller domain-containing protein n=1 Tax=Oryza sativa subsp. japonica TaxID=39947 RepID=Q84MY6_ORYSJ|nr:hypothetical protein Os03g40410 [Oryza sativa Japonica Group]